MTIADELLPLAGLPELTISPAEIRRARELRMERALDVDLADAVITRVERQAAVADRPAVRDGLRALSYSELAAEARRTATLLERAGVAAGTVVAVGGARGAHVISAFLALELLGAVYVPADANWPRQRVTDVLGQSGAVLLLCTDPGPVTPALAEGARAAGAAFISASAAADCPRGRGPRGWRAPTSRATCSSPPVPPAAPRAPSSSTRA